MRMRVAKNFVIWDFDGTLARRNGYWRECLIEALDAQEPGHPVTREVLGPLLRNGFLWHNHETEHLELNDPESWWQAMEGILGRALCGTGFPQERAPAIARAARGIFLECSAWEVFEDVLPALSRLKDQGWSHAILSNHVPELSELVADLGLADLFDVVVTSARIGYEKPHPMAYKNLVEAIGEVENLWMVGDNPIADVVGAERVGIPGILVRSPEWTDDYISLITESWGGTAWRDWQGAVTRKAADLSEAADIIAPAP